MTHTLLLDAAFSNVEKLLILGPRVVLRGGGLHRFVQVLAVVGGVFAKSTRRKVLAALILVPLLLKFFLLEFLQRTSGIRMSAKSEHGGKA